MNDDLKHPDPRPGPAQPGEPVDGADPSAASSATPGSNRRQRVLELLSGAALLSTTALLPVIDPKNPPFRAD